MKVLIEEYGMMIVAILAAGFLLYMINWLPGQYKYWSREFIAGISGVEQYADYVKKQESSGLSYDYEDAQNNYADQLTLEEIESWY
jgi:hypothetical protein